MFTGSLVLGICGVVATGLLLCWVDRGQFSSSPERQWFLGLAALFPAWLVAFLDLVPELSLANPQLPLPRPLIYSSGTLLLGIIFTHYLVRRLKRAGAEPSSLLSWLLGVAAFVPAWCILLWSLP